MCVILLSNFCLEHFLPKMCTEMHVDLYVKRSLKLSNLNETWNGSTVFCKIVLCVISWRSVKEFSSCHAYRQAYFNRCSAWIHLHFKKSYCVVTNQNEILFLHCVKLGLLLWRKSRLRVTENTVVRKYLLLRTGENCIMRSCISFTHHPILLEILNQGAWDWEDMKYTWGNKVLTKLWLVNLKGWHCFGDLGIAGKIIFKMRSCELYRLQ
jgi:hypothetical protein